MGIKLFISYSSKDKAYRESLKDHLSSMERNDEIETWSDREILPGKEWDQEIRENLKSADIIVLLISSDFITSDYCFGVEVKLAMEKHERGDSIVLPVIVRACDWENGLPFAKLQALPEKAKPVKKWDDQDDAWLSVVRGIRDRVKNLKAKKSLQPFQEKDISSKLQEDFKDWLEDTEIQLSHRRVNKISLSDIYVPPHLKLLDEDSEDIAKQINIDGVLTHSDNLIVFGDEQSGKTSLAKYLFGLFLKTDCLPVFLDGKDIKSSDIKEVFRKTVTAQYKGIDISASEQIPNKILILDNFSEIKLNRKHRNVFVSDSKNFFDRCIFISLDSFRYVVPEIHELDKFKHLEILPLGHLKRSEIVERWISLGIEEQIEEEELYRKVDELKLRLNSLVRGNVIPAKPVYILAIMQIFEAYTPQNLELTSYGHCYQYLVYQALEKTRIKSTEIDKYLNVLTELAWTVYKNESVLTDENLSKFFTDYGRIYSLKTAEKTLIVDKLKSSGLLRTRNDMLSFRYPYIYYFFIARKIAESLNTDDKTRKEAKNEIKTLLSQLHRKNNANIIIFISHHIKDKWILDEIQLCLMEAFCDQKEATLSSNSLSFMEEFIAEIPDLVLEHKEVSKVRRQKDETIDEIEKIDAEDDEPDLESSDIFVEINKVFKGMEIIGQILRNRHASIRKDVLFEMVKSATDSGLRFLQYFIEISDVSRDEVVKALEDILKEDPNTQVEDLEKEARDTFLFMIYGVIFGVLIKISASIGSKEADEIYDELERKTPTPAIQLINQAITLQFKKQLDFKKLKQLSGEFRSNPTCRRILKEIVVQHIYMFPVDYRDKQRLSETLRLPMQTQRLMDKQEKVKI